MSASPKPMLHDHYVICNWNTKTIDIVSQLRSEVLANERKVIVIVTTRTIDERLLPADSDSRRRFEDVVFYPGDPTRKDVLERVNSQHAAGVIVLADDQQGVQADARNLLTLFALSAIPIDRSYPSRPHIIAEIVDVTNYAKFKHFEQDPERDIEIIRAESLRTRILAQAARTPGLVGFFHDLLTYSNDSNEVYSVGIPGAWIAASGGCTFGDISDHILSLREIALTESEPEAGGSALKPLYAIAIGLWRESDRRIVTLPPEDTRLQETDKLVVISRQKPDLHAYAELLPGVWTAPTSAAH